ncbi:MAG TPA: hypothetical protein VD866_25420, partial [Urbifossiella sp.]|nr:hypothetical protein [Urbifossiella sp.]
ESSGKTVLFSAMYLRPATGVVSVAFCEESAGHLHGPAMEVAAGGRPQANARGLPTRIAFTITTPDGQYAIESADLSGALLKTTAGKRAVDQLAVDAWAMLSRAADGIIFLLDITAITTAAVAARIQELNLLLAALEEEHGGAGTAPPVAVCFSQMDKLWGRVPDPATADAKLTEHLETQPELKLVVNAARSRASRVRLFAVSSFGHSLDGVSPPPTGPEPVNHLPPWAWLAAQSDQIRFDTASAAAAALTDRVYPRWAAAARLVERAQAEGVPPGNVVAGRFRTLARGFRRSARRRFGRQLAASAVVLAVALTTGLAVADVNRHREVARLMADPTTPLAVKRDVVGAFVPGPVGRVVGTQAEVDKQLKGIEDQAAEDDKRTLFSWLDARPGDERASERLTRTGEFKQKHPAAAASVADREAEDQKALARHEGRVRDAECDEPFAFAAAHPDPESAEVCEQRARRVIAKYPGSPRHEELDRLAAEKHVQAVAHRADRKFRDDSHTTGVAVQVARRSGTSAGSDEAAAAIQKLIAVHEARDLVAFRDLLGAVEAEGHERYRRETDTKLVRLDGPRVEAKRERVAALATAHGARPGAFPDTDYQTLRTQLRREVADVLAKDVADAAKHVEKYARTAERAAAALKDRDVALFPNVAQRIEADLAVAGREFDRHLWKSVRDAHGPTGDHLLTVEPLVDTYLSADRPVKAMAEPAERLQKWIRDARAGMQVKVVAKTVFVPSDSPISPFFGWPQPYTVLSLGGQTGGGPADRVSINNNELTTIDKVVGTFRVTLAADQTLTLQLGTYRNVRTNTLTEAMTVRDGRWIGARLNEEFTFANNERVRLACEAVLPPPAPEYPRETK